MLDVARDRDFIFVLTGDNTLMGFKEKWLSRLKVLRGRYGQEDWHRLPCQMRCIFKYLGRMVFSQRQGYFDCVSFGIRGSTISPSIVNPI